MWSDPVERGQALCVPLFYGLMEAIVLGIYCIIGWKLGWTKAPRDEKFCVVIVTTYEVDDDDTDSELVGGQIMDEERQQAHASGVNTEPVVYPATWSNATLPEYEPSWRRPWSLFNARKRKDSEETENDAVSPASSVCLEAISQIDSITDLVPFPPKVEYSRCRVNSEEGTAITSPISETASNGSQ